MKWLNNAKIGKKLTIGFLSVVLAAIIVGVFGLLGMLSIEQNLKNIVEIRMKSLSMLSSIQVAQTTVVVGERGLISDYMLEPDVRKAQYDLVETNVQKIKDTWAQYCLLDVSADEAAIMDGFSSKWDIWMVDLNHLVELSRQKDNLLAQGKTLDSQEITDLNDELYQTSLDSRNGSIAVRDIIINLVAINDSVSNNEYSLAQQRGTLFMLVQVSILAAGIAIAIFLSIAITRAINKPVNSTLDMIKYLSGGDLTKRVDVLSKDELGAMAKTMNSYADTLGGILREIYEAAEQVASGAEQVASGSQELSQGATEQASSVEQLTSSVSEIAAQTKQNAENANSANRLSDEAMTNASVGNAQMQEMLKSMENINASSANISRIIKVIDEIAFQTNILALNAAVEAARAGQQGKGFAVVAEEVRNLAAKSAQAAKETTALIETSINMVDSGTTIARKTAESLDRIVRDVSKAAELIGQIAVASNEQAAGIAQIDQGIEQVSLVV